MLIRGVSMHSRWQTEAFLYFVVLISISSKAFAALWMNLGAIPQVPSSYCVLPEVWRFRS